METPTPIPVPPIFPEESQKNWFKKHMLLGYLYIVLVLVIIVGGVYLYQTKSPKKTPANLSCNQQNTVNAKNNYTGEIKEFPTPCDVPSGWIKLSDTTSNPYDSDVKIYKNDDYGFQLSVPVIYKGVNYQFDGLNRYIGIYINDYSHPDLVIYPRGGASLFPVVGSPEVSTGTVVTRPVTINKWKMTGGNEFLIQYNFTDKFNNWTQCNSALIISLSCARIDLHSFDETGRDKLVKILSSIKFYTPIAKTTNEPVYFVADNKLHIYNPATKTLKTENFEVAGYSANKLNDNILSFGQDESLFVYKIATSKVDEVFSKKPQNGMIYRPSDGVLSVDQTQLAISYKYGKQEILDSCDFKCDGEFNGVSIYDLTTSKEIADYSSPQANVYRWVADKLFLMNWAYEGSSDFTVMNSNTGKIIAQNVMSTDGEFSPDNKHFVDYSASDLWCGGMGTDSSSGLDLYDTNTLNKQTILSDQKFQFSLNSWTDANRFEYTRYEIANKKDPCFEESLRQIYEYNIITKTSKFLHNEQSSPDNMIRTDSTSPVYSRQSVNNGPYYLFVNGQQVYSTSTYIEIIQ